MRCSRVAPDVRRFPIVDQPAGAVIAVLLRMLTCATIKLPVATDAGRVTVTDVLVVELAVAQPPPGHAATSAIGSTTYGAGGCASSRGSSNVWRRTDQRSPAGVTSRPVWSRIATGRMRSAELANRTEPSAVTRGAWLDWSCHCQVRAPTRWSTSSDCSTRLTPNVIASRPNGVGRATPLANCRHGP